MKVDTHTESQLQRLLTEDDRLAEQGIRVIRLDEDRLSLSGEVESPNRRDMICKVIAEEFPELHIQCDIGVTRVHEPDDVEEV
jgi:hypothetical protein